MTGLLIKDVMSKTVSISKSAVITEALDKMLHEGIDPLVVTNNGTVAGTVTRKALAEILGKKRNTSISPSQIHVANAVEEDFTSAYPDEEIDVLIPLLQRHKIVVVLDEEHRLVGHVGAGELLAIMKPDVAIGDVIETIHPIQTDDRVIHLRRKMLDEDATKFIVYENNLPVGIVTETDVASAMRKFREDVEDKHQKHQISNLLVRDIMSTPLVSVNENDDINTLINTMLSKRIGAMPVSSGEKIAGVVTRQGLINML